MIGSSYFVPVHPFSMARISASDGICISALTLLGSVVRSVMEGLYSFRPALNRPWAFATVFGEWSFAS